MTAAQHWLHSIVFVVERVKPAPKRAATDKCWGKCCSTKSNSLTLGLEMSRFGKWEVLVIMCLYICDRWPISGFLRIFGMYVPSRNLVSSVLHQANCITSPELSHSCIEYFAEYNQCSGLWSISSLVRNQPLSGLAAYLYATDDAPQCQDPDNSSYACLFVSCSKKKYEQYSTNQNWPYRETVNGHTKQCNWW